MMKLKTLSFISAVFAGLSEKKVVLLISPLLKKKVQSEKKKLFCN